MRKLGWQWDAGQRLQKFGGTTGNMYDTTVLVQHDASGSPDQVHAYVYAFHGG